MDEEDQVFAMVTEGWTRELEHPIKGQSTVENLLRATSTVARLKVYRLKENQLRAAVLQLYGMAQQGSDLPTHSCDVSDRIGGGPAPP